MQVIGDRERAGELCVNTMKVGQQLRNSIFGAKAGIYKENGEDYDIYVRFNEENRYNSSAIFNQKITFRDMASGKIEAPKHTVLATIPIYNVGGSLNRNTSTRTNQNGPKAYGFRGNARNFDLNRDFIKSDTKNAKTFAQIFHLVKPDVFIDNHVSNGADYQYTLTHLFTQHNKLGGQLGAFINGKMLPEIEKDLQKKEMIIIPGGNLFNN